MFDSLLPPSATSQERAIEESTSRVSDVPTPIREMWNADTCPVNLLPWLAWAFSVDDWNPAWSDDQKRATIKASYQVHRKKGTIGAIRVALNALGLGLQIVEWFEDEPVGDPYTFHVHLTASQFPVSQAALINALAVIRSTKNLRSHLVSIDLTILSEGGFYIGAVTCIGVDVTIGQGVIAHFLRMDSEDDRPIIDELNRRIISE